MFALGLFASVSEASAETRTLKLYNLHTKEKATITYKRGGRYDAAGLKEANRFLRDWRRNEPTKMDPQLLDLVWEVYKASGSKDYIHVVCGYRAPATNSMLRSRSKGVAQKSQHMLGRAMDFYIPDVKLKTVRDNGLRAQRGGVGYYPRSGSPFVHLDVGSVRHWPRMSRKELVSVFPNGKTLHVPSDGKPLPGYEQAVASYNSRKKSGGTALALASTGSGGGKSGGLLASLFGGGADEEEDNGNAEAIAAAKPAKPAKPAATAKASSGTIKVVPPELAEPVETAAPVEAEPEPQTPEAIIAALPERSVPLPAFAPRPKADVGAVAAAAPETVPFGVADAAATADAAAGVEDAIDQEIASNVPLPTWRPDTAAPAAGEDEAVLMALAGEAAPEAGDALGMTAGIPLPEKRPNAAAAVASLAALPAAGDVSPEDAIAAEVRSNNERLAMLTNGASPRAAVVSRPEGSDPALAVGSGVKTTRKAARASASDGKPAPKPQVVEAAPDAARWALSSRSLFASAANNSAPSVAHHIVRTAPSEVYATGFQKDGGLVADAGRFSGKAVSFLPVARFETN